MASPPVLSKGEDEYGSLTKRHWFRKYGVLKFNPISPPDTWILEGYPEYVANKDEMRSEQYSFTDSVLKLRTLTENGSTFIEVNPGQFDPLIYFKGRVMIEYLIDIKKMSFDEILHAGLTEKAVYSEMLEWVEHLSE